MMPWAVAAWKKKLGKATRLTNSWPFKVAVLLGPADLVRSRAVDVLRRAAGRTGHIFNLGHGVPPDASLENLQLLVETVHSWVPASVT